MTEQLSSPIVYIDANRFIYLIDGDDGIAGRLRPLFALLKERPGIAVTSELTLAEVLAKARPDTRRSYFNLIVWSNLCRLHPVTRDILIDTADYRRESGRTRPDGTVSKVRLPDAIHVVTAVQNRCRAFLSADVGLRLPVEMTMFEPSDTGVTNLLREIA
jgi:predicted nucleic acid-binding protein